MRCGNCHDEMVPVSLSGHNGKSVHIDLCSACEVLWFDHMENVALTPRATLELFKAMHKDKVQSRGLEDSLDCGRCQEKLKKTFNMSRTTRFAYFKCPKSHGHLITFFEFLREKDFVRPLSPEKLAELKTHVQQIQCSACGASIDLQKAIKCGHCGAAVSFLDPEQVARTVDALGTRAARADITRSGAEIGLDLMVDKIKTERLYAQLDRHDNSRFGRNGLLEIALGLMFEIG